MSVKVRLYSARIFQVKIINGGGNQGVEGDRHGGQHHDDFEREPSVEITIADQMRSRSVEIGRLKRL